MVLGHFEAAFVINADGYEDRWESVQQQLANVGITNYKRFRACVPAQGTAWQTAPQLGCTISHISVIDQARSMGLKNVLILEDDAVFAPDFLEHWERLSSNIPKNYDLLYLYDWSGDNKGEIPQWKESPTLATHCYVVNASAYDYYIKTCCAQHKKRIIDHILYWFTPELKKWVITPSIVGQGSFDSMLTNSFREERWEVPPK